MSIVCVCIHIYCVLFIYSFSLSISSYMFIFIYIYLYVIYTKVLSCLKMYKYSMIGLCVCAYVLIISLFVILINMKSTRAQIAGIETILGCPNQYSRSQDWVLQKNTPSMC